MDRVSFDDVDLTYRLRGRGQRVLLIHASPFVSWYEPLVGQLGDFNTLSYRPRPRRDSEGHFRALTRGPGMGTAATRTGWRPNNCGRPATGVGDHVWLT